MIAGAVCYQIIMMLPVSLIKYRIYRVLLSSASGYASDTGPPGIDGRKQK